MKLIASTRPPGNSTELQYHKLPLVQLIAAIVHYSDRFALEELHSNRTLFSYGGEPPLCFIDFLNKLRESEIRMGWSTGNMVETVDRAFDLTIDKFTRLPAEDDPGVDCRVYFKAFLDGMAGGRGIRNEAKAAAFLQGLVRRHFYFSLLEAERKTNPFWSRYNWEVKGGTICVWLPVWLKGRKRREWLEKNIDFPNPEHPEEQQRVQGIINQNFPKGGFVAIEERGWIADKQDHVTPSREGESQKFFLAETVAEEKGRNIEEQRLAIKALGEKKLKQLVLRIFNDLKNERYKDMEVARDFGLTKATFSRFAGSKWLRGKTGIPDLWQNTAEVLSANPDLKEIAIRTGVWKKVKATLEKGGQDNREEPAHE